MKRRIASVEYAGGVNDRFSKLLSMNGLENCFKISELNPANKRVVGECLRDAVLDAEDARRAAERTEKEAKKKAKAESKPTPPPVVDPVKA